MLSTVLEVAGLAALVIGAALIFVPAAWIVAGACALWLAKAMA